MIEILHDPFMRGLCGLADDMDTKIVVWTQSGCAPCHAFQSTNPQQYAPGIPLSFEDISNGAPSAISSTPMLTLYVHGSPKENARADASTIKRWQSQYGAKPEPTPAVFEQTVAPAIPSPVMPTQEEVQPQSAPSPAKSSFPAQAWRSQTPPISVAPRQRREIRKIPVKSSTASAWWLLGISAAVIGVVVFAARD